MRRQKREGFKWQKWCCSNILAVVRKDGRHLKPQARKQREEEWAAFIEDGASSRRRDGESLFFSLHRFHGIKMLRRELQHFYQLAHICLLLGSVGSTSLFLVVVPSYLFWIKIYHRLLLCFVLILSTFSPVRMLEVSDFSWLSRPVFPFHWHSPFCRAAGRLSMLDVIFLIATLQARCFGSSEH